MILNSHVVQSGHLTLLQMYLMLRSLLLRQAYAGDGQSTARADTTPGC